MDWSEGKVTTKAGSGKAGFKNGPAIEAEFNRPMGLTVDQHGNILVADSNNHCIRRINKNGEVSTFAGVATEPGHRDGPCAQAMFNCPNGLVMKPDGNLFVADSSNHRVRKISPDGLVCVDVGKRILKERFKSVCRTIRFRATFAILRTVSTVAGSTANFQDGSLAVACFSCPSALALAWDDSLVVTDTKNHRVRQISAGGVRTLAGNGQTIGSDFGSPVRVAGGRRDVWVVANSNRVCKISQTGESTVLQLAGCKALGGLLVDCRGNAIVTDFGGQKICFCSPQGDLSVIAGQEDGFMAPNYLAMDQEGHVVLTDTKDCRVRTLSLPSTKQLTSELSSGKVLVGCATKRSEQSLFKWMAVLTVPEGSFRGGIFELSVEMPFNYPVGCPLVRFVSPITHPNVDAQSGEVAVQSLWQQDMSINSLLAVVRQLLVVPNASCKVNPEAWDLWQANRLDFDTRAHEEARQTWMNALKPSVTAPLICDLFFPPKLMSRASQHQLFSEIAKKEIAKHVAETTKYEPALPVTVRMGPGSDSLQRDVERATHQTLENLNQFQNAELKQKTQEFESAKLNLQLTQTITALINLQTPRAALLTWLEEELARLCVAEKQPAEPMPVIAMPSSFKDIKRPETSEECFKLLLNEADTEIARLSGLIGTCIGKYELLYSRFESVKKIENISAPTPTTPVTNGSNFPESDTPSTPPRPLTLSARGESLGSRSSVSSSPTHTQQLNASARLLIAQAKLLEPDFRRELQSLVDSFNSARMDSHADLHHTEAKFEDGEVKQQCLNDMSDSYLRLPDGLRVHARFGPMKSLVRLKQKGLPVTVLDYARATVVFADPLLLTHFYNVLGTRFAIKRVKNKFLSSPLKEPPNVHVNVDFHGHVCEIQLTLEDFIFIKQYSHKPYEIRRIARDDNGNLKSDRELRQAIEHVIADGIFSPHPGLAEYPAI